MAVLHINEEQNGAVAKRGVLFYAGFVLAAFIFGAVVSAGAFAGLRMLAANGGTSTGQGAEGPEGAELAAVGEPSDAPAEGVLSGSVGAFGFEPGKAGKVIFADLKNMQLTLYQDGAEVMSFPIQSKGRPGTAWETPAGDYRVRTKEENHFSSIGHVWMPYSMQFYGNYFIHGWPYYDDGSVVPQGYSGGCIRLSTEDAHKVFDWSDTATVVSVYGTEREPEAPQVGSFYELLNPSSKLSLTAEAYLVADIDSGDIIIEKSRNRVMPMASVTKLFTALTSLDVINQYGTATISGTAVGTYGTAGELSAGERIVTGDLLYPLLLESSNDAAEALAEHYGRSLFITRMNDRAAAIGLRATAFEDASGLSENNVSTAEDLFKIARYIYRYKRFIFEVTKKKTYSAAGHTWTNGNKFLDMEGYLGGKNGFTDEAGRTGVALFELPLAEFEKRKIAVIVLASSDREGDVRRIVEFLKKNVAYQPTAGSVVPSGQ
jgi:D-alanyl-D-alanine carboxypeptidase